MSRAGLRLGRYRLLELLGAGGMAEAWRADDGRGGQVVIKRVLPSHAGDPSARRLLLDEARLSLELRHPGIVGALEVGDAEGEPFVVLELVDGCNLAQVIGASPRCGRPPPGFAAFVAAKLCRALAHAHGLGLVHRDVSPSNVMIGKDGAVKLLDFGVARLDAPERTRTAPGVIKGKRHFMAPEQLAGGAVDARADLFAVGVVLWETLTGRSFTREALSAETIPAGLARICRRALEPDRERRFPDATTMAEELEREAASLGGNAELVAAFLQSALAADEPERTAPTREARLGRPHSRQLVGAVVLGAIALGVAAALVWHATRTTRPPPPLPALVKTTRPAPAPAPPPVAAAPPARSPSIAAASSSPAPRASTAPRHEHTSRRVRKPASASKKDPLARQKDLFDPF